MSWSRGFILLHQFTSLLARRTHCILALCIQNMYVCVINYTDIKSLFPSPIPRVFLEPMLTLSQSTRWQTSRSLVSSSSTMVHSKLAGTGWSCWPLSMLPSPFPIMSASPQWRYERTVAQQLETLQVSATSWWRSSLSLVRLFCLVFALTIC